MRALLLFIFFGAVLFADDILILKEKSKILKGKIVELTKEGVKFKKAGATTFIKNKDIDPKNLYNHHKKSIDLNDSTKVVQLAEFAVSLELYSSALDLYKSALKLDQNLRKTLETRIQEVTELSANQVFANGESYQAKGNLDKANKMYKKVLARYPESAAAPKAKAAIEALIALKEEEKKKEKEKEKLAKAEAKKAKGDAKVIKAQKYITSAEDLLKEGLKLNGAGLEFHGKGNVTKATKSYEKALKNYKKATKTLIYAKRYTKDNDSLKKKMFEIYNNINKSSVSVYNNMAVMFMADKNYKRADKLLRLALRIDPTNTESLKLKAEVDENRISFSASKRSNVKPIVTNN